MGNHTTIKKKLVVIPNVAVVCYVAATTEPALN